MYLSDSYPSLRFVAADSEKTCLFGQKNVGTEVRILEFSNCSFRTILWLVLAF